MKEEARFKIGDLLPIAITFVVVTIALAVGLQITGEVQDDMTALSAEANATADGIEGMSNLSSKLPLIATVVISAIIIGIVVNYFVKL